MENTVCEKLKNCPIFQKGVLFNEYTGETYKTLYCLRSDKYPKCKRYLVSQQYNCKIPETIMPNSSFSVEEIIARIKQN